MKAVKNDDTKKEINKVQMNVYTQIYTKIST